MIGERSLYFISLLPMILLCLLGSIGVVIGDCEKEKQDNSHYTHTYEDRYEYFFKRDDHSNFRRDDRGHIGGMHGTNIFAGLSDGEAKKKYRELLKQYHPDNVSAGNEDVAKQIIEDYQSYQKKHG